MGRGRNGSILQTTTDWEGEPSRAVSRVKKVSSLHAENECG